ncbi:hypothetical protein RRG08_055337 [Elysia crispata]|uniref:Uncharacterized protein n=1 Tax=Elysia crispata TaxID=231223 RepID=A0AAE1AQW5_9GAST|nr:hypothetical protein RRG08_055337 [Elysia crispata]
MSEKPIFSQKSDLSSENMSIFSFDCSSLQLAGRDMPRCSTDTKLTRQHEEGKMSSKKIDRMLNIAQNVRVKDVGVTQYCCIIRQAIVVFAKAV